MSKNLGLVAISLLTLASPVRADDPYAGWLADLRKAEEARGIRSLTLTITQREAAAQPGETIAAARARLAAMPGATTSEATLLLSPAGWREDWTSAGPIS